MKRCPQCNHVYTDDLSFCLSDGTPLIALLEDRDPETVVRSTDRSQSPEPSGGALWLKVLAGLLVLFFGFIAVVGILAWVFWPRDIVIGPGNNNASNISSPTPTPPATFSPTPVPTRTVDNNANEISNIRSQQEELERERKRLADERRRLEEEKNKPPATPKPPPRFNDPGTTRLTFRRGSVGTTTSGTIGRQRGFVLRTLAGQYLSASVSSAGGCVTFNGGGTSTGYTTRQGDSYLYLRNNCSDPARFTLSVTVR
ncbi:MAG: hypothetical protein AB7Q37_02695 [Pyrinomonadaceae bacterium]